MIVLHLKLVMYYNYRESYTGHAALRYFLDRKQIDPRVT